MPEAQTPSTLPGNQSNLSKILRGWLAVFLVAFVLFAATANRGAQWQDSGFHILRVVTGESINPLGLALSHPLHHWLGRLIVAVDLFEPCFAVTLISVIAAAVAVANTYGCVLTLTGNRSASLLAAASLGLAHTFWQVATVAETYTLAAALLSAECWCLVAYAAGRQPRYLCLMCLFNGLGIANHMLASLTTPVLAAVVLHAVWRKDIRIKHVAVGLVLWAAGSTPYSCTILTELIRSGDFSGTIHSALFGHAFADRVLNLSPSPRSLLISAGFIALSFPNVLLPAALYGILRAARFDVPVLSRRALLAGLVIHVCFVGRYNVVDQHMFFVPFYVVLSTFGGIGFAGVLQRWRPPPRRAGLIAAVALLALTPIVYAVAPTVARKFDVLRSAARHKPYRDDYVYVFTPWSVVERSAERMSREAVTLAGDRGLILVEDGMAEFAIRYRALREGLDGLRITRDSSGDVIREQSGAATSVVLVPLSPDRPRISTPVGSWRRIGDLYVLSVDRAGPATAPQSEE